MEKNIKIPNDDLMDVRLMTITALTAAQVLNETLDDLKETSFYKSKLKTAGNQFSIQLTNTCNKHIDDIWGVDERSARQLMDGIMEISKAIAKMKPSQLAVFGDLLKTGDLKYEENEDRS